MAWRLVIVGGAVLLALPLVAEMNTGIPQPRDPALVPDARAEYPRFQILVAEPVKIPVQAHMLRQTCRTRSNIVACTFFASEKLVCSCNKRGKRWEINAEVSYVPVMYLRNLRYVEHEKEHLDHVRGMLARYLDGVVRRSFSNEEDCNAAAEREKSTFLARMNAFRLESNRLLR